MPYHRFSFSLIILLLIITLQSWATADITLYATDFSDATGWETNSPSSFYFDEKTGRYHYQITGGTGAYAYYPLPEPFTGQFTLEFDVYPILTEEKSSFRFGLGTDGYDSQKGPVIIAELYNQNGEKAFALTAITKENLRSQTFSIPGKGNYGGKTVRFTDGDEYHIRLTWYPAEKRVSVTVTEPGDNTPLFSHFVMVTGKMEDFTHLFLTSVGEGQNGRKAEGFIDNISLTSQAMVKTTPEPTITTRENTPIPTLITSVTPIPDTDFDNTLSWENADHKDVNEIYPTQKRTPLPTPPIPVPTEKSGLFPLVIILGLGTVFIFSRSN